MTEKHNEIIENSKLDLVCFLFLKKYFILKKF
jgi:hypothetical protein